MVSSDLKPHQLDALRQALARQVHYLNRLCRRMEHVGFPPADALYRRAIHARNAAEGLLGALESLHRPNPLPPTSVVHRLDR